MNQDTIGYWNIKKEQIKRRYTHITDEDLLFRDGKEKEMMDRLGYKLGKTKEELVNLISMLT